ncbi:phage Gp37/Gp68 family protein [Agrobacterium tumefaciens]|uniref:phage Gp37/Gp68 family protein n=1 Tax=Agrobacterium tumefaciens TaxID=358 RepID=UPI001574CA93|nr:phage Gp37/Gp68 family protein [Agrobacterium tumefaciens]
MAENSAISWTRHTWNPWMGCTKVSPACDGCYAEALMDKRYGKVQWGNHPRIRTGAHTWNDPMRWQRQADKDGDRPFVFCASLADIFDNQVDPQWRVDAFDVMRKTPRLVYLLLTKRPQNIVRLADAAGGLPENAAIGTTVEDQKRADINLPALHVAKIELRPLFTFGSFEPLLGPIIIRPAFMPDWIITGGETDQGGHKARPTHPDWFRSLRDQATAHGSAFHHKQNGEWVSVSEVAGPGSHFKFDDGATVRRVGKKLSGRTIDGVTHDAFPEVSL